MFISSCPRAQEVLMVAAKGEDEEAKLGVRGDSTRKERKVRIML